MELQEIINLIEEYKKNHNIINDNNYLDKIGKAFKSYIDHDFIDNDGLSSKYSSTIEDVFTELLSIPIFIDYYVNDDEIFSYILSINLNNFDSIESKYHDRILEFLRTGNILEWQESEIFSNKNIFEFICKYDKSLLSEVDLTDIFLEFTKEDINNYGDIILEYIDNIDVESLPNSWRTSEILFDYMKNNRKDLLYKLNLQIFFSLITSDMLNDYGDVILQYLKYIKITSGFWRTNEYLFEYIKNNQKESLYQLELALFFPTLTWDILDDYGDEIIKYLDDKGNYKSYYELTSEREHWLSRNSKILFYYLKDERRDLLPKLYIYNIFPTITSDILTNYGDIIIKYIDTHWISFEWINSQDLFDYLKNNRRDLLIKLNLKDFFPEITEEILTDYGDIILKYIDNIYLVPYPWNENTYLFTYLNQHRRDLLHKLNLGVHFPEITEEILTNYGDIILKYIKEEKSIPTTWFNSKKLFNYVRDKKQDLLYKLNTGKFMFDDDNIEYFANLYGIDKKIYEEKIRYLYEKNVELFETLNFDMLKIDGFSKNLLIKFTLYPDIQDKIINLDSNTLLFFIKIANMLNVKDIDLTSVVIKVLDNINNYKYLLEKIPISELDDEKIKYLVFILEKNDNVYNIDSLDDLTASGFKHKQDEYLKNIANNLDKMDILKLKGAIFEKLYGIDYDMAETIYNMYAYDLERLEDTKISPKIINILLTLDKIMKCASVEELKLFYQNIETSEINFNYGIFLESAIRKEFAKIYKDTLYHVREEDKSKNPSLQNVTYEGKKIEFYEVSDDFNMMIHVVGAYGGFNRRKNYKNEWIQPKIAVHGICTSYIGNNQIATAPPNGPILGFTDYEDSALLLSGNYDLGSVNRSFSVIAEEGKKTRFLSPKSMIDGTRHNHNEMVIERTISLEDGTLIKRMPSYIVYIIDDINDQNNFVFYNDIYQEMLQASHDFNIPIVIVDRLKIAKREFKKCLNLEKEFLETKDSKVLEELFLTYMNNAVGCREFEGYELKEYHKVFDETVVREFYKRIYSYLKDECDNLNNDNIQKLGDNLVTLIKLLIQEKENYGLSHKAYKLKPYIDFDLEIENLKKLLEEYKKKVSNIKGITIENIDESHINM